MVGLFLSAYLRFAWWLPGCGGYIDSGFWAGVWPLGWIRCPCTWCTGLVLGGTFVLDVYSGGDRGSLHLGVLGLVLMAWPRGPSVP